MVIKVKQIITFLGFMELFPQWMLIFDIWSSFFVKKQTTKKQQQENYLTSVQVDMRFDVEDSKLELFFIQNSLFVLQQTVFACQAVEEE